MEGKKEKLKEDDNWGNMTNTELKNWNKEIIEKLAESNSGRDVERIMSYNQNRSGSADNVKDEKS